MKKESCLVWDSTKAIWWWWNGERYSHVWDAKAEKWDEVEEQLPEETPESNP